MKQKNLLTLNKIIYYLPIFILIISLATKITLYLYFGTEYWLDENIVSIISKQNLPLLFETVKAEPHPPGFYIFLKLFAVDEVFPTRLALVFISYFLSLLALIWGYKNNVVSEYKLSWGMSLFISSYTFLELTAHIKQEILSFPILLLFFLVTLKAIKPEEKPNTGSIFLLNLLTLLILSLGYLYYLVAILTLISITLKFRKSLLSRFLLATQLIIFTSYFVLFAREQLLLNATRFSWHNQNYNSFWRALSIHLIGYSFNGVFSDVLVLIFIGAFTLSAKGAT